MRHECCYTWTTCDRCHRARETRKIRRADYCRACYPIILGLPDPAIDDSWLPLEPFEHLIAAARFIAATERYGPGFWENYSIGFLRELPISLAYNTEIIVQILPYLNSLSELPAPLKRYEPQLRFALDAVKLDNTMLMALTATLHHIYEFKLSPHLRVQAIAPEARGGEKCAGPVFSRRWLHPEKLSDYGPFIVSAFRA